MKILIILFLTISTLSAEVNLLQLSKLAAADEGEATAKKADKTGTNPINFSYDLRLYSDYTKLNLRGNGEQSVTTLEYRMPLFEGKWQFRLRVPYSDMRADLTGVGNNDINENGLGDINFRMLTVPYINKKDMWAVAYGVEFFLPTASREELGAESVSIAPQIFWVKFNPLGLKGWIFAPAYQHKLSIASTGGSDRDINQSLFDFFFLWASSDKQYWALIDPQVVLDHETDKEFGILDVEVGTMLDRYIGTKGHSIYIRPSLGMGDHSPIDYGVEIGYKIIW